VVVLITARSFGVEWMVQTGPGTKINDNLTGKMFCRQK
jgi:hypothetical protein